MSVAAYLRCVRASSTIGVMTVFQRKQLWIDAMPGAFSTLTAFKLATLRT